MRSNLQPDTALASRLFDELKQATSDGLGVTRDAYGAGEQKAHDLVKNAALSVGLEPATDPAGNLYLTLPGTDRAAPAHRARQSPRFRRRAAAISTAPPVFSPGSPPSPACAPPASSPHATSPSWPSAPRKPAPGSPPPIPAATPRSVACRPNRLRSNDSIPGQTSPTTCATQGFDPDWVRAGNAWLTPRNTAAYVELHIEQGPVLDSEQIPVAIVTGIPGSRRLRAGRVTGEYNHSGATPRRYRRDAAIALAELATRLDDHWERLETEGHQLVCTFCVLATTEAAGFTKIPGEAVFQLDVRSVQPHSVDAMFDALHRFVPDIESRRGVTFDLGPESTSTPSLMDSTIQDELAKAAETLGISYRRMPSGGGHDAAAFIQAGIPACMLFVRNQNGSHNPHEAMRMEDFAAGCAILTRWAAERAS